jgi:hypothetical protein
LDVASFVRNAPYAMRSSLLAAAGAAEDAEVHLRRAARVGQRAVELERQISGGAVL